MIHSFTCSGILPTQYIHLSQFAGLGALGYAYIKQGIFTEVMYCFMAIIYSIVYTLVYNSCGYIDVVHEAAQRSTV